MFLRPQLILVPAMCSSLLLAGCGGAGIDVAQTSQASPQAMASVSVQLEGCVINSAWSGAAGTAVHVRTADGRLVGTAFTNASGVFVATVPARTTVVLGTLAPSASDMVLNTGSGSVSLGGCLFADL